MYNSQEIAAKIKETAKKKGVIIKKMLSDLEINVNTISMLAKGREISYINFAKIAEYLNCSVDYLLGRINAPDISANDNITSSMSHSNFGTVNGSINGNVSNAMGENITINNSSGMSETSNEYEYIIALLNSLDKRDRRHAIVDIECMLEDNYKVKKNNE